MADKSRLELEEMRSKLDSSLSKSKISKRTHSKGLCALAYEYSISGFIEESIDIYLGVSQNYFNDDIQEDIAQDHEFFIKMNTWFELLSYAGYVPYDIMATQSGAKA